MNQILTERCLRHLPILIAVLLIITTMITDSTATLYDEMEILSKRPILVCELSVDPAPVEEKEVAADNISAKEEVVEEVKEETAFDYYVRVIKEQAEIYGVDPVLAVAISRLETGNWTSDAFVNNHNFGGLMGSQGLLAYDNESSGLESFMKCLAWYNDKGMCTPEGMASVYCPDDSSWAELVRGIMGEVE